MQCRASVWIILILALSTAVVAQYPQPYPQPGQYPPTTGPYPQDPYPSTYPARLPGGVPIGIPVPEIKLPKRKGKSEDAKSDPNAIRIAISAVEGTLRKFSAKELILESTKSRILRFRLLAKTQFRDKSNQPIRDSLLQPGDRLSVHVNSDDPETVLRVVLQRAGTSAERTAAAKPVDEAKITEPLAEHLTQIKASAVVEDTASASPAPTPAPPAASEPFPDQNRPVIRRTPAGVPQAPTPPADPAEARAGIPAFPPADPVIDAAREASEAFTEEMPNFLVHQITTRYQSSADPPNWRAVDIVTLDLTSERGKEEYKNIRINGRPTNRPVEDTGSWSTGEFVTTLQDILSPSTNAAFTRKGEARIANRAAYRYDLSVEQQNSHWVIHSPRRTESFNPAYTGSIWIDKETKRVLRIEMKARKFPSGFPWNRVDSNLEYGYVSIDNRNYLLPTESDGSGCETGTSNCSRNVITFRNYRKFGTDSKIVFDRFASSESSR